MKKEVELKFPVKDLADIKKRLKKIGARFIWAGKEKNWYLDTPDRVLRRRGIAFRVRENKKGPRITLKENVSKGKFKIADEYEISINDAREAIAIFSRLGFREFLSYTRRREYWKYGKTAEIVLDTLSIGKFVEIESSPQNIRILAEKLGLSFAKSTSKSYVQLLGGYLENKRNL